MANRNIQGGLADVRARSHALGPGAALRVCQAAMGAKLRSKPLDRLAFYMQARVGNRMTHAGPTRVDEDGTEPAPRVPRHTAGKADLARVAGVSADRHRNFVQRSILSECAFGRRPTWAFPP